MMRLRRFLVLGIPACGSATPREEPPRPPLSSIEALTPAPDQVGAPRPDAAVATFDPRSCAIDQVPQSICGHYDETCTPESLRESSEIWRNEIADKYRMSGWQFDPATTEVWKERAGTVADHRRVERVLFVAVRSDRRRRCTTAFSAAYGSAWLAAKSDARGGVVSPETSRGHICACGHRA
jgi:hypothetical protein